MINETMTTTTCYFCDATEEIEEHHILPQRFDGSDLPTNTVELCHDCHWKLERLYNKEFWNAIGVDDPRAAKESHLTCSYHGCIENAVGRFETRSGLFVHRCEDHKPSETKDSETAETADKTTTQPIEIKKKLETWLNLTAKHEQVTKQKIEEEVSTHFDYEHIQYSDIDPVTELTVLFDGFSMQATKTTDGWSVESELDW